MSAEKIIKQIQKDSQNEIKQNIKNTDKIVKEILEIAKKEAEEQVKKIEEQGKQKNENLRKILISKASQDAKKQIMVAEEKIIEECFVKAQHALSTIEPKKYKEIVTRLIIDGKKKLGENCIVLVSRDIDREIAKSQGLKTGETIDACGGIIIRSQDGKITLDHTFDGIFRREKDKIRIKVGKLLFS